ncbi:purine-nucleoside phosphorylase [Marinigracilibium pacificum]|uniref:Purine nucleoside phosphorylase n=1 Tax=Marinigracilibium pacificum TaxID=2729599 RepID=A0A848J6E5_9BACT|nr:purine-nucleoside phosphorylase [Marinigracilibium pacificum]NMM50090.1 purine-nucleoside phosphorylase [Marinigracilibium pacificum]
MLDQLNESLAVIKELDIEKPEFGIILGTGLGKLVDKVDIQQTISYDEIPHFPISTVESHSGRLIFGKIEGKSVVIMQGRFHYYEGYSMQQVTYGVRVMKLLGISKLIISNAAGGLNNDYEKSDLMIIEDHINLFPENPLRGKNEDELGPRFPDMFEPYDKKMIAMAMEFGRDEKVRVHKGVYAGVQGPNLETPAEYKFLRIIGADAVGMSSIPENIVAVHMGIPVFAISVITDLCTPEKLKPVSIPEIIASAEVAEPAMTRIIAKVIAES